LPQVIAGTTRVWGHALDTTELVVVIAVAVMALLIVWLCEKWAAKRLADRLVAEVLAKPITFDNHPKLKPESDYVVEVSDTGATCLRPDGKTESVKWDDLQRVEILTTDEGPFLPDVFWVLYGSTGGCVVPWGATGERELIERLQALAGFHNDAIVNAACLTTNNRLLCWERTREVA
jgi:hypothetical protein